MTEGIELHITVDMLQLLHSRLIAIVPGTWSRTRAHKPSVAIAETSHEEIASTKVQGS
jgi:hypothetical protein